MVIRLVAFFVAGGLAASSPANAMAEVNLENSFDFATLRTPIWTLTATTNVHWERPPAVGYPIVSGIECTGRSDQFGFTMNGSGDVSWLAVSFLGKADEDGEREQLALLGDRLWLYIDGQRWEYANIPAHSGEFSNIEYPPPESDVILPLWRGHKAVRRNQDQPWINFNLLNHRLITAKRIEWSFKSRDWTVVNKRESANQLPKNWKNTRYKVDNEGLQDAILWCARQVSSKDAYILPAGIREQFEAMTQKK